MFQIKRKDSARPILRQNVFKISDDTVATGEYLTFPLLEELGLVNHLISTRLGGVSEGEFSSMNFSSIRGDREENVAENYRRMAGVLQCEPENMVGSHQTHTTNIRRVTGADKGMGIIRERDYSDIDGLITDEPGICLVTYYADCVPLLFVDPVNNAIGLAHSGWRGTVNRMGQCVVDAMREQFGTNPAELYAAVGPSICQDCYEVSEDVALQFMQEFPETDKHENADAVRLVGREPQGNSHKKIVLPGKVPGKYQLNLWRANERILSESGIPAEHISVTDICTCCNSEYLFSHRASGGRRGNIAAFLMLKQF